MHGQATAVCQESTLLCGRPAHAALPVQHHLSNRDRLAAGAARLERAGRRAGARRPGAPPARGTGARSPGRARPRRSVPRARSPAWCCRPPGWPWCWRRRSGAPARPGSGAAPRACLRRALLRRRALRRAARLPCTTGAAYVAAPDLSHGARLYSISSGASASWSPVSRCFQTLWGSTRLRLQRPACPESSAGASAQSGASSAESSPSKLLSPLDEHAQAALHSPASRALLLCSNGSDHAWHPSVAVCAQNKVNRKKHTRHHCNRATLTSVLRTHSSLCSIAPALL